MITFCYYQIYSFYVFINVWMFYESSFKGDSLFLYLDSKMVDNSDCF